MKKSVKNLLSVLLAICVMFSAFATVATNVGALDSTIDEVGATVNNNYLENDFIKLVVNQSSGRFVLGTTGGNPSIDSDNNKKLLYGFNSNSYTSYSTMRVDGNNYIYGQGGLSENPVFNAELENNISKMVINGVEITQTLSIINNISTNRDDVLEIRYDVKNSDSADHSVGTRIMLDTMLGSNDNAPFRIEGIGNVTTEKEFTGDNIPQYWQAFDSLTNPTVVSQGTFIRGNNLKPDKVQFANWSRLKNTSWNYQTNENYSNGDSAVAVTWDEKTLRAGETRTYTTYYGMSEIQQDLLPPLAISVYGDNAATRIGTVEPYYVPLAFSVYVQNIGEGIANNAYVKIELPDNMFLPNNESDTVRFTTLDVNEQRQISWHINISAQISQGTYPVTIKCGADGIEEKAITRYITVPPTEVILPDNRILWGEKGWFDTWTGRDNLGFTNSQTYFDKKYTISDEYFNRLTKDLYPTVIQNMNKIRESDWGGSCYGMSSVISLMKAGYLTPSLYQDGATVTHDLKSPKNNSKVMNLVNFYHLSQLLPDITDILDHYGLTNNENRNLNQLITETKKVKTGGLPVSFGFFWYEKDKKSHDTNNIEKKREALLADGSKWTDDQGHYYSFSQTEVDSLRENGWFQKDTIDFLMSDVSNEAINYEISFKDSGNTVELVNGDRKVTLYRWKNAGHEIIAYDVDTYTTDSDDNKAENGRHYRYRVSICDPNKEKWTYLWVSADYNEWYYHHMALNASSGERSVIHDASGNEEKIMPLVLSDVSTLNIRNPENDTDYVTMQNYNRNFIQNHGGTNFTVTTGGNTYEVKNESLSANSDINKIYIPNYTVEGDGKSAEELVFLPEEAPKDSPMTVTPIKGTDKFDATFMFSDYSFSVDCDYTQKVIANPENGSVQLNGKKSDFALSTTFNSGCDMDWYTLSVNGKDSTESSLKVEEDGIVLEGDNLNNIHATANNTAESVSVDFSTDKDSAKFMQIDSDTIGVYIDKDDNGTFETLLTTNKSSDKDDDKGDKKEEATPSQKQLPASNQTSRSDGTQTISTGTSTGAVQTGENPLALFLIISVALSALVIVRYLSAKKYK